MAALGVFNPRLENLFKSTERKFSKDETRRVFEDSKKILMNRPQSSLYEWLLLLHKQGQITNDNVILIKDYLAKQSSNKEEIEREVDDYLKERPVERPVLTGRNDEIERIISKLRTDEDAIVNVYGAGGVGKTTLAKRICHRWDKESVGRSLTVDLREVKEMKLVYYHILQALEPYKTGTVIYEEKAVFKRVRQLTKNDKPVLVLLDNSEQFAGRRQRESNRLRAEFLAFLTRLKSAKVDKFKKLRILLTSRKQFAAAKVMEDFHLRPLEINHSRELLKATRESSNIAEEEESKVLEVCGGRPLLINTAAAALRQEQVEPEQLICMIEEEVARAKSTPVETVGPSGSDSKPGQSEIAPDRTTRRELEADLQDSSFLRSIFFNVLSKELQDAAVSLSLFCHPFPLDVSARILDVGMDIAIFLLESLRSYNFITPGDPELKEPTYDVHPMLKALMNGIKREEEFKNVFEKAENRFAHLVLEKASASSKMFDQQYADIHRIFSAETSNTTTQYHEIAESAFLVDAMFGAETATNVFRSWGETANVEGKDCVAANLRCWEALNVFKIKGSHKAFEVLKKAKTSLDKASDVKDTDMFKLTEGKYHFALGQLYQDLYQEPKRALEEFLKSHDIFVPHLGDHTETARCLNATGNCYQRLEESDRAVEYFKRAYDMRERLSGEIHCDMPVYKSQIGAVFDRQGDYDTAIKYYQSAIDLEEKLGISGYENTAIYYRNIANAYLYKDKYSKAMEPATKAYEIRDEILGKHPETTRSLFQLGLIWYLRDKKESALQWYNKAWEMEKSLGTGNHSVVRDRIVGDLRSLYYELRRKKEKKSFEQDALRFYCRIWEEEKSFEQFQFTTPNRKIINMIIDLQRILGDPKAEMKRYQREALSLYEKTWEERDTLPELKWDRTSPLAKSVIQAKREILEKIVELAQDLHNEDKVRRFENERLGFYKDVLSGEGSVETAFQLGKVFVEEALKFCGRKWKEEESRTEEGLSQWTMDNEIISVTLRICEVCKKWGIFSKEQKQYQKKALPLLDKLWKEEQDKMEISRKEEIVDVIIELASTLGQKSRVKEYTKIKQNLEDERQRAEEESSTKRPVRETDTSDELHETSTADSLHHKREGRKEDRKLQQRQDVPLKGATFKKALTDALQEIANNSHSDHLATPSISIDTSGINSEEFSEVLTFLCNKKVVKLIDSEIIQPSKLVFLEPQWLIDVLKGSQALKEGLSKHQKLDQPSDQANETKAAVLSMKEVFVLCDWPSPDKWLVPQMLTEKSLSGDVRPVSAVLPLSIRYPSDSNFQYIFLHVIACLLQKCAKKELESMPMEPHQNFARFILPEHKGCYSLVLLSSPPVIEVKLCASIHAPDPTPKFVGKKCGKWFSTLRNLHSECSWLKDTSYELCFRCPVCKVLSCRTHNQSDCTAEKCFHFFSEKTLREKLQKADQVIPCPKATGEAYPCVQAQQVLPWLDGYTGERQDETGSAGPTLEDLADLSEGIADCWFCLGINLGVKQSSLTNIRCGNVQFPSPKQKALEMLMTWKEGHSGGATMAQLERALRKVGKECLAQQLSSK